MERAVKMESVEREERPTGDGLGNSSDSRLARLAVGLGAPLFVFLGCRWLLHGGGLCCLFRELTGLYCPGCGSGRAAIALLRGHPLEAVGYNPLLFLLGLPCGALLLWEYLRFVFPGLALKKPVLPAWAGRTALVMILSFWLLRNLPGFAFLAPDHELSFRP